MVMEDKHARYGNPRFMHEPPAETQARRDRDEEMEHKGEQTPARPGQVWKSTDRRKDRRVRVVELSGGNATVVPVDGRGDDVPRARQTRVRLDVRGRLTRYRLVC